MTASTWTTSISQARSLSVRQAAIASAAFIVATVLPQQARAATVWYRCSTSSGYGTSVKEIDVPDGSPVSGNYVTSFADSKTPENLKKINEQWLDHVKSSVNFGPSSYAGCYSWNKKENAEKPKNAPTNIVSWNPTPPTPQGAVQALTLDFEPGDKSFARSGRGGYQSASIKLKYRFLLCAGEIQIAYALDRKSLEHSAYYVDRFNGINPNTVTPQSEPPVPITVPIALGVYVKGGTVQYRYETKLADVRDKIAGDAVGMGCFTGQTKTIGTVAKLLGPDAKIKPMQIKTFLDQLIVKAPFDNYTLDFPLINPDVPAPPVPAPRPRAPARKKAHR